MNRQLKKDIILIMKVIIFISLLLLTSCVHNPQYPPSISKAPRLSPSQQRKMIVKTAKSLLGRKPIIVNGVKYPFDCSGLVRAVYQSAGIDLYGEVHKYPNLSGVKLIYKYCEAHGSIKKTKTAKPGDIIFFDNTYDKNKDKKSDDKLTHVAIVEKASWGKTITFIHVSSHSGIVRDKMNLNYPDVYTKKNSKKVLNDFLRVRSKYNKDAKLLSGQLFAGFGVVIR